MFTALFSSKVCCAAMFDIQGHRGCGMLAKFLTHSTLRLDTLDGKIA